MSMSEMRGAAGLCILLVVVSGIRLYRGAYGIRQWPEQKVDVLASTPGSPTRIIRLASFDPDTVSAFTLESWGVPGRVASNWVKYREKAGGFSRLSQISGLYGMTDSLFLMLRDSIRIPEKEKHTVTIAARRSPGCPAPMDVNLADTTMLARLHGIGRVLSRRIVLFREKLGGFVDVQQVGEIYGLSDSAYRHISDRLYVDEYFSPRKLNLVSSTYQQLYDHPYISSRQATAILRYRIHHPDSVRLDQIIALDQEFREKIRPYVLE